MATHANFMAKGSDDILGSIHKKKKKTKKTDIDIQQVSASEH